MTMNYDTEVIEVRLPQEEDQYTQPSEKGNGKVMNLQSLYLTADSEILVRCHKCSYTEFLLC